MVHPVYVYLWVVDIFAVWSQMKLYFWIDTFSIQLFNNQLVLETFGVGKVGYVGIRDWREIRYLENRSFWMLSKSKFLFVCFKGGMGTRHVCISRRSPKSRVPSAPIQWFRNPDNKKLINKEIKRYRSLVYYFLGFSSSCFKIPFYKNE